MNTGSVRLSSVSVDVRFKIIISHFKAKNILKNGLLEKNKAKNRLSQDILWY